MKFKFLLVITLLYVSGCASNVSIDYNENISFANYKTYQLIKPDNAKNLSNKNPEVDNSLVRERIESALHDQLQARGYELSDEADFFVTYFLQVKQEIETRNSGVSVGYGSWGRRGGIGMRYGFPEYNISTYDRGTLTIDILEPADKTLVWRGSTSRRLNRAGTTPESNNKIVQEVVHEILSEFPPGVQN